MSFKHVLGLGVVTLGITLATNGHAQNNPVHIQANMAFGLEDSDYIILDQDMAPGQPLMIELPIAGASVTLDLQPKSIRSDAFQLVLITDGVERELEAGDFRAMRGSLLEDPGSSAAASLLDEGLYARISLSSADDYWLEPVSARVPNAPANAYVLYHTDDTLGRAGWCGADLIRDNDPKIVPPPAGDTYTMGMHYTADLGIDSDVQYYNSYIGPSAIKNQIEKVINGMDVQYERDVNITHRITKIILRDTTGPYTSTNPSTLLNQFRNEWNSNQSGVKRDVAHLFTGKNLDGNVIGVAFLGVVCQLNSAYGLVQSDCCGSFACATDLSAHELGHNWNAGHCNCSSFTMNSGLTCSNRFNPSGTIPAITGFRNSRNCLDDPLDGDVLFEDDFENGNLGGSWACSGAARCKIKVKAAYNSLFGLQLKKTVDIDLGVDTTGYSQVTAVLAERSQNYESHEFLTLFWFDGSNWNQADQWQQKGWREKFVSLPAAAGNNASFAVRFRCNAKGKQERSKIDNVVIVGN